MNCKKCGSPLTAEDQFCKNCGASVNEVNAQPMENNNGISQNAGVPSSMPNNGMTNNAVNSTPNMNQNMNGQNGQQPVKSGSKNTLIFIIMGVVIVALIVCVIILIPKKLESPNNNGGTSTNNNGGGSVVPASTSTYKVSYGGFTFKIPDNLIYKVSNNVLFLADEDETWVVQFMTLNGSFDKLKKNASQLQGNFQKNGFTAKAAEIKEIGGSEFITVELANSGTNALSAYAKLNPMTVAVMYTYNQDNEYDYDVLKNIASIISTATYEDPASGIETQNKFDFIKNDVSELAQ